MELRVRSVNVGLPRVIGLRQGAEVISGIAKAPLAFSSVHVSHTNIEGDGQADLSVHGGRDKAVYCYPTDHWTWWASEKNLECRPGAFGENLTVEGADETSVAIGDHFRWGEVLLEVSQPRAPCFKFAIYTKRDDAPPLMTASARSGWYCRVLEAGRAPVTAATLVRERESGGPTVRDAFLAVFDRRMPDAKAAAIRAAPGLAQCWRDDIGKRFG